MEDIRIKKRELRASVQQTLDDFDHQDKSDKTSRIADRLFGFANFQESRTVLFYSPIEGEVETRQMMAHCLDTGKVVLLPVVHPKKHELFAFRVEDLDKELRNGSFGRQEPDPRQCKPVPLQFVDLAIIPGIVFDERGGRIGYGRGHYDRLIPQLPMTTRKVALSLEAQLVPQVPMEAHDRFVDIIITEDRIIYKI